MRTLLVSAILAGGLLPYGLNAQRGGGGHGGGMVGRPGAGRGGIQTGGFGNRMDGNWWNRGWNNRSQWGSGNSGFGWGNGAWGNGGWGYSSPYSDDAWSWGYGDENQTSPMYLLVPPQGPPEPVLPPPPPQPAHPVMHEYIWDKPSAAARFSIAPKNGPVRQALAVWVQDNEVRYTTTTGGTSRIAPAAIDCAATNHLNATNNLRLALPGCAESQ